MDIIASIENAKDLAELEVIRQNALGKKGEITQKMKGLGGLSPDERKEQGKSLNLLKQAVEGALAKRKETLEDLAMAEALAQDTVDVTLPARGGQDGCIHPITQTIDEAVGILAAMGFTVAEGPEIEDDFHNFTALNIPPEHPARQMHDTFYMAGYDGSEGSKLLRTHTSPVQIRTMMSEEPPIRIIAPGRTFRSDSDATHTPMFHQIEGLVIDEQSHMGHLKGCLLDFCRTFFDAPKLNLRFRPSYFPFTEPSAEVDIGCKRQDGQLKIGSGNDDDWLEVLGCGMVHPKVLENCGIDTQKYQGFAFGLGVERLAMLKYGITDLRTFFDNDVRWLKHYGFHAADIPKSVHL